MSEYYIGNFLLYSTCFFSLFAMLSKTKIVFYTENIMYYVDSTLLNMRFSDLQLMCIVRTYEDECIWTISLAGFTVWIFFLFCFILHINIYEIFSADFLSYYIQYIHPTYNVVSIILFLYSLLLLLWISFFCVLYRNVRLDPFSFPSFGLKQFLFDLPK